MQRDLPPYRADHVGSLLRPPVLKQARGKFAAGQLSTAELKAVEDSEIKAIVAPSSVADRVDSARPIAATVISLMGPLVGRHRLARWLRFASFALVAVRLARNWRDRPR